MLAVPVLTAGVVTHVLSAVWNDPQPDLHPALRDAVLAVAARAGRRPSRTTHLVGDVHAVPAVG